MHVEASVYGDCQGTRGMSPRVAALPSSLRAKSGGTRLPRKGVAPCLTVASPSVLFPSGFVVPTDPRRVPSQGTGIVNTLLFDLPWQASHPAFRAIGSAFLILDIALFLAFSFITILRYALHPAIFLAMLKNETHSLFLGTIPMGLVTVS